MPSLASQFVLWILSKALGLWKAYLDPNCSSQAWKSIYPLSCLLSLFLILTIELHEIFYFSRCVRILGKQENIRVMQLALFQGIAKKHRAATTIEMKASENPVLQNVQADPTIVCTSFKKNRFYMVCNVLGDGNYISFFQPCWEFYFLGARWQCLQTF